MAEVNRINFPERQPFTCFNTYCQRLQDENYDAPCSEREHCSYSHSGNSPLIDLGRILWAAETRIDVCTYAFKSIHLKLALVELHKKRVTVRIIVDSRGIEDERGIDEIPELAEAGILVKVVHDSVHPHGSFAIIDGEKKLFGTFDWTFLSVQDRSSPPRATYCKIDTNSGVVRSAMNNFEELWNQGKPPLSLLKNCC